MNSPKLIQHLEFSAPIKTVSESNGGRSWVDKLKRKKAQRDEISYVMHNALGRAKIQFPCVVKLTRIGPKKLDAHENLRRAFKAIVDAIAAKLGVDDGEEDKVTWEYDQTPIGKREYSVKVEITSMGGPLLLD